MAYYGTYSNQAQGAGPVASGQLVHQQPFTLVGTGFGTKTTAAPVVYDNMSATTGTIYSGWNSPSGNQPTTAGGNSNMQLQLTSFSPTGATIGAPDPFVAHNYAGCHLNTNTGTGGNVVQISAWFVPPTYPYPVWVNVKHRADPNWTVDPASDNNYKDMFWSDGKNPQPANNQFWYLGWNDTTQNSIKAITQGNPTVVTIATTQASNPFAVGEYLTLYQVVGMTQINGLYGLVSAVGGSNGSWTATLGIDSTAFSAYAPVNGTITGITNANPGVVTISNVSGSNPFAVGDLLSFSGVAGMTQINNDGPNQLVNSIGGSSGAWTITTNIDTRTSSGYGTYTSGGTMTKGGGLVLTGSMYTSTRQYGGPGAALGLWQNPDANGHNSSFWGQALYPLNPNNGWIDRQYEIGVTDQVDFAGGYCNVYDNLAVIENYVGKTENSTASGFRCFSIGDYCRDRGANNFRYYGGPIALDVGETGQVTVPRVLIGDASTLGACTQMTYAPASSWSNTSITATFWKGNFTTGQTVYPYIYNGNGSIVSYGGLTVA